MEKSKLIVKSEFITIVQEIKLIINIVKALNIRTLTVRFYY